MICTSAATTVCEFVRNVFFLEKKIGKRENRKCGNSHKIASKKTTICSDKESKILTKQLQRDVSRAISDISSLLLKVKSVTTEMET